MGGGPLRGGQELVEQPCSGATHGETPYGMIRLNPDQGEAGPDTARHAAHAAVKGARYGGPSQCHGLAGNADVLLDAYAPTGDRCFLDDAQVLGRLLEASVWHRTTSSPVRTERVRDADLMTGWAGLLAAFLRLHDPQIPQVMAPASLLAQAVR